MRTTSLLIAIALGLGCAPTKVPSTEEPVVEEDDTEEPEDTDGASTEDSTDGTGVTEDTGPDWDPNGDSDGDGLTDAEEGRRGEGSRDTDGDGTPDYLDTDSDGDGIPDEVESTPRYADGSPMDSDGDGTPDYLDLDSDADGIPDADEAVPADEDGNPADTDGDGIPDYRDTDSDGDGLLDSVEGASADGIPPDTDADGIPDYREEDSDDDGLADRLEGAADWDSDGVPNWVDARNDGGVPPLNFTAISTEFNAPIGIDFHEPTSSVVMSVNYSGGSPNNFERVELDGSHVQFSSISGLSNEVKIATARTSAGGFTPGELFVGNGVDGQIVRVSADGTSVQNPWVDLPGSSNGLLRGSLYVDRTGVWNYDLLAVTNNGEFWRIDSSGNATLVADVGVHLEGLVSVPDKPARFGTLAGLALAGAENQGVLYGFDTSGTISTWNLGVAVEDIDYVEPYENFFGVNYGTSRLVGVLGRELLPMAGDIILTQEFASNSGLFHLRWTGTDVVADVLEPATGSATLSQWEHVTTAAAGIQEIPN